ncbi:FGGY family carbohydrate kinase [uncultured Microbacterium sp.]|uniref:FGGY family carbohydrate kinase n=1 Tax=uncultured Microbacterium sp. TaxID=191216 RepID=UPI0035CA46A8
MIIGVDVGTTAIKAAAVHRDGTVGHAASRRATLRRRGPIVEQRIDDVIIAVSDAVREIVRTDHDSVEAIAITGQGDGLWLRGVDGRETRPAISWMDGRAAELVNEWLQCGVVGRVFDVSGCGLYPGSHMTLMAWMQRFEPQSLTSAATAGYCNDAIVERLTGRRSVHPSDAVLSFWDSRSNSYRDEALGLLGLTEYRHLLPQPSSDAELFVLSNEGARLLDVPIGTPVSGGPYDLLACSLGVGASAVGDGTIVLGTTLSCQVRTSGSKGAVALPAGMHLPVTHSSDLLQVMPSMVGTAGIDWLFSLLGLDLAQLDALVAQSPIGANGVRCLSSLSLSGERAPFIEPFARGTFTGLSLSTSRADLVRAFCESLAYVARHCFEQLPLTGRLIGCGGGLMSDGWAQMFADVLGREILVSRDPFVGARGAAMNAWTSLGWPTARAAGPDGLTRVSPDASRTAEYDEHYDRYRSLLESARLDWATRR